MLLVNKRFELLQDVALQYNALHDELNGIEIAKVTTAFPITPELEAKVLAKMRRETAVQIAARSVARAA